MSRRGLNVSPLVVGDTVYMGQGEENLNNSTQGMLLAFKAGGKGDITDKADVWKLRGVMDSKSSPILVDGRVYAADDGGNLYIVDAETGKRLKTGSSCSARIVRGSPLYADGKIYICSTSGWHCFRVTKDGLKLLQKLRLDSTDEVSGSPIVSHGRIFLPTGTRLYCLGKKDQKPAATPIPAAESEKPVADDDKPTQLQVVPAEALLAPGGKQQFQVRLFNDRGQFLKDSDAKFSLTGPGKITKGGEFKPPSDNANTATIVTAKVGDVTGQARIRVVPPLPWKFDFQKIRA